MNKKIFSFLLITSAMIRPDASSKYTEMESFCREEICRLPSLLSHKNRESIENFLQCKKEDSISAAQNRAKDEFYEQCLPPRTLEQEATRAGHDAQFFKKEKELLDRLIAIKNNYNLTDAEIRKLHFDTQNDLDKKLINFIKALNN